MSQAAEQRIPEIVSSKLKALRLKVWTFLFLEGLSWVLPTILLVILVVFGVDRLLEMDVPQRIIISILGLGVLLYIVYQKWMRPFWSSISDDALCLEVEKHHEELHDELISAVQFSRDFDAGRMGVSRAMVEATIAEGTRSAEQIDFADAINNPRMNRNLLFSVVSAGLLVALFAGMWVNPTLNVFMHRMLFYDGAEYARNTYLEFYDPEGRIVDGVLKIYRGQDCPLLVRVREDSKIKDVPVKMYYRDRTSGYWVADDMIRTRKQDVYEYRIVYKSVAVEFEVQARGGDGRTERLQVKLEEPPQFSNLSAEAIYPDYCIEVKPGDLVRVHDREKFYRYRGPDTDSDECWEEVADPTGNGKKLVDWGLIDQEQLETATQEAEEGTAVAVARVARDLDMFTERAYAKKLKSELGVISVRSEFERNQLRDPNDILESFGGRLSVLDGCSIRLRATANRELAVAELVHQQKTWSFDRSENGSDYELLIPADELLNGQYVISLRDATRRTPPRAANFEVEIHADKSPEVRAALKGISGLVINRAKLPMTITLTDDYGATDLVLRYAWQDDGAEQKGEGTLVLDEYEPVPSWDENKSADALKVTEILPSRNVTLTQQFFDLDALPKEKKIPEDSGLKITIVARDNDNVPGPNTGVSKEILLRVVSEEEFRADLLRREKEARQEFDLIYKKQQTTRTDTEALAADSKTDDETLEQFQAELKKRLSEYTRSQRLIGENVEGVIARMEDLLTEGLNNRLDETTGEFETRYTEKIIGPMQTITDELMILLKTELDSARREVENDEKRAKHLNAAVQIQQEILTTMEAILKEMDKNESLQELINLLFEAKKSEAKLFRMTADEIKKRIRELKSGNDGKQGDSPDKQD